MIHTNSKPGYVFTREYWTGDSRDGRLVNGDGYHYYRMVSDRIVEAYEVYETDEGLEIVSPLPEMLNIGWMEDLGFEDWDALDVISEAEFMRVQQLNDAPQDSGLRS